MKKFAIPAIAIVVLILMAKFFIFRGGPPPGMGGEMPPPVVETTKVSKIDIREKITATGRVEAPLIVDIRPRIEGYLKKAYFKEGSFVNKGDLLFLIDPDPFIVAANRAKADLQETKAALEEAEKNFIRITDLVEKDYASKAQLDEVVSKRDRLKALLNVKHANLENASINLGYTKIHARISGKIGKIAIDEGNVVSPAIGTLARIVSLNPIYVNYSINTEDYLKLKKENKTNQTAEVEITMPDNSVYPEKGKVVFYDNEVNAATGTIAVRAEFSNPDYMLIPGQYVSAVMYIGKSEKAVAVPQEAVLENPQGKYVYIIDKDGTVNIRPIKTEKQYNGFWTITEGLEPEEKIVSKGVQKLRPGIKAMDKEQMENMKKTDNKKAGKNAK